MIKVINASLARFKFESLTNQMSDLKAASLVAAKTNRNSCGLPRAGSGASVAQYYPVSVRVVLLL